MELTSRSRSLTDNHLNLCRSMTGRRQTTDENQRRLGREDSERPLTGEITDIVTPRLDTLVPTLGGLTTDRLACRWGSPIATSKPPTWANGLAATLG